MNRITDNQILHKLIDDYPSPMLVVDIQADKILLVNKPARELIGIKEENTEQATVELAKFLSKDKNAGELRLSYVQNKTIEIKDRGTFYLKSETIDENKPHLKKIIFEKQENDEQDDYPSGNVHLMLNNLPLPIFFKDLNGFYTGCNVAFEKFLALDKKDIIGKKVIDIIPNDIANYYESMDKQIFDNPGELIREGRLKLNDGKFHDLIIHKATYYNSENEIAGIVGVIFDISDQKSIQKMLKKSEKELVELNASKDKFFSILAHDLKNPFSVILGITNFLVENYTDFSEEEIIESLQRLNNSSRHLFTLFENLLEWSRLQRDSVSYIPVSLNLKATSKVSFHPLVMMSTEKRVKIVNNIPSDINVIADEKMLETIFRNLISNAIKYSDKNSEIKITANENLKGFAEISIIDYGIGMDDETIGNLFKIENVISKPGTNKEQGTGLGLILCREFVNKNGGTISVESNPGKGSKFKFTIPLYKK